MRDFAKYHWITIALAVFILVICVLPNTETNISVNLNDKVAHILAFAALGFIATRGAMRWTLTLTPRVWVTSILFPWLWGGAIELIQLYFIPTRHGDWLDFLADGIGVLIGFTLALGIRRTPLRRWM